MSAVAGVKALKYQKLESESVALFRCSVGDVVFEVPTAVEAPNRVFKESVMLRSLDAQAEFLLKHFGQDELVAALENVSRRDAEQFMKDYFEHGVGLGE